MSLITKRLPALPATYALTAEHTRTFREQGHAHTPGVLTPAEAADFRAAVTAAVDRLNTETRPLAARDTYGQAFLQIMNLWEHDAAVRHFVQAPRFARVAADLLGVDNVRIYHDQALFKEPGGGPTPWHQDQYYWPLDTEQTVTMWMPLVDVRQEMGTLVFASGSHERGTVFEQEISDDSAAAYEQYVREQSFATAQAPALRAGDATWHYGATVHRASANDSARMREVMTIIYFADGARVTEPRHAAQRNDHRQWLQSLPVGAPAASALNPALL